MPSPGPANRLRDHAVAAAWGAAEATFLPVVPDVWISRVALRDPRRALATTVTAMFVTDVMTDCVSASSSAKPTDCHSVVE